MIYSGLEFGQYFELEPHTKCHNILLALTPATRMVFIFIQMYFIFLNNEVSFYAAPKLFLAHSPIILTANEGVPPQDYRPFRPDAHDRHESGRVAERAHSGDQTRDPHILQSGESNASHFASLGPQEPLSAPFSAANGHVGSGGGHNGPVNCSYRGTTRCQGIKGTASHFRVSPYEYHWNSGAGRLSIPVSLHHRVLVDLCRHSLCHVAEY